MKQPTIYPGNQKNSHPTHAAELSRDDFSRVGGDASYGLEHLSSWLPNINMIQHQGRGDKKKLHGVKGSEHSALSKYGPNHNRSFFI